MVKFVTERVEQFIGNGGKEMLHKNGLRMGFAVLVAAGMAGAHLVDGSLSIKGGETFTPGQSVSLKWNISVLHGDKIDLHYSKDGGTTWTSMSTTHKAVSGDNTFKWTVPNEPTTKAKVRVCQGAGSPCADVKVSSPSTPAYALVSPVFTISAGTGVLRTAANASGFSIDFRPEAHNVDASFGVSETQQVVLQAFDTQGRMLATLVDGSFAAGSHKLSLFSERLDASSGSLVFKLKIGNQVQSLTWTR
jgi:hypothetical protein